MIEFDIENELLTPAELQAFEAEIGLTLPEDYKAHMLKYNGGTTQSDAVFFGVPDDGILLFYFASIKYGTYFVERHDYLPEKHITIARTGTGNLAMSLDEKDYGSISVYYSEVELGKIADSFTDFLANLSDYTDELE